MAEYKFKELIEEFRLNIENLYKKGIIFVNSFPLGNYLLKEENDFSYYYDKENNLILGKILSSSYSFYKNPALIDLSKMIEIYKSLPDSKDKIKMSFLLSRVSILGTDGVRGKVSISKGDDYLRDFLTKNLLTPKLVENLCYSFAKLAIYKKIIKEKDFVCIGEDGRDVTTNGALKNAMILGFMKAGLRIYDLGKIPTGFVPYFSLKNGIKVSAMLTASHNPSDQNGVKFFLNGKKILPENEVGDYSITAWVYKTYLENSLENSIKEHQKVVSKVKSYNIQKEAINFILNSIIQLCGKKDFKDALIKLRRDIVILDTSNGAYTEIAKKMLKYLKLNFVCINEKPTGYNINRACGVADLEGYKSFSVEQKNYNSLIKKFFEISSKISTNHIFGISLDGDGDRCFLLFYNKNKVYILDGDKCGYILAKYFVERKKIKNKYFVSTVESDLMLSYSVKNQLKLKSQIVSVGDKWICNFDKKLIVGVESSGHLIIPIKLLNNKLLLTGNGLITGLLCLVAIKTLNLSDEEIIHPFEEGISSTYYTYFVDKSLFYKNSEVWKKDEKIVEEKFRTFIKERILNDVELVKEEKEDFNMLFYSFKKNSSIVGTIFVRNSGTEDKIATYAKGNREIGEYLDKIALELNKNHRLMMKKKDSLEYKCESLIIEYLKTKKVSSINEVKNYIAKNLSNLSESNIFSILYALKKEKVVSIEENNVSLL